MIRAIIFWSKAIANLNSLRGGHENKLYVQDDPLGHLSEMRAAEFLFFVFFPPDLCKTVWEISPFSEKADIAILDDKLDPFEWGQGRKQVHHDERHGKR